MSEVLKCIFGKANTMDIKEGLLCVKENIANAAQSAGKTAEDIKLVAVSKFKSIDDIKTAYSLGVKDFGENYIQEFTGKYSVLSGDDILWHIIGPVQRNKVKYIADKNVLVQTVDRISLAEELAKYAEKHNKTIPMLIQVNTCGEDTKSGCTPEELFELFDKCKKLEGLSVQGLMTIGPNTDNMYEVEKCFEETYELYAKMQLQDKNIKYLSMGMTNDYTLAIKHGADIVRVGRAIFGERQYNS